MNAAFPESKQLIVLTADAQQKQTVETLLSKRWQSLGIRQIQADIFSHPRRDPGVYHEAGNFLASFVEQYSHALVMIDAEWGDSTLSVAKIQKKLQSDLDQNGWRGRSAVVVLDPELEIWVWSRSAHVPKLLNTDWKTIKKIGQQKDYWNANDQKPTRPKELLEFVLRKEKKKRSSSLFVHLAQQVSLASCQDESFNQFRKILCEWFAD